jgi:hypothetical protein
MRRLSRVLLGLTVAVCATSSGCSVQSWSGGSHSSGGVDVTHLARDGRVFLVMATSDCVGGSSGNESGLAGSRTQGQLNAADGRKIAWSCTTADGTSGTVVVDGQEFDLAKGGVLLISLRGNKTKVEQLAVEMSKLQGGPVHEKVRGLADEEPRIAAFFKGAQGGQ